MLKLEDNPEPISPGLSSPGAAVGTWCVAHTKPRMEKALAWDLVAKKVSYFLPMARRTILSGGRRRTTLKPLFPSYLFFCGDDTARITALTTRRVVNVLNVPDQQQLIHELDAVHAALKSDDSLDVYPHVAVGRRCRVARGPLRGLEGTVVEDGDSFRIVLRVSIIGSGTSLQISAEDLEAA